MSSSATFKNTAVFALAILGACVLVLKVLPILLRTANWAVVTLLPLALAIAGIASCLLSSKPGGLKLLWILVIFLAPLIGPLLWFFWGRKHT